MSKYEATVMTAIKELEEKLEVEMETPKETVPYTAQKQGWFNPGWSNFGMK
jgi:hypothetical protein